MAAVPPPRAPPRIDVSSLFEDDSDGDPEEPAPEKSAPAPAEEVGAEGAGVEGDGLFTDLFSDLDGVDAEPTQEGRQDGEVEGDGEGAGAGEAAAVVARLHSDADGWDKALDQEHMTLGRSVDADIVIGATRLLPSRGVLMQGARREEGRGMD